MFLRGLFCLLLLQSSALKPNEMANDNVSVTTPRIGVEHFVERGAVVSEGFDAKLLIHDNATVLQETKTLRVRRGNDFTLAKGTVLLPEKGRWFCTLQSRSNKARRFSVQVCLRDGNQDGFFDQSKLKGTVGQNKMKPPVGYKKLEKWTQVLPQEGEKKVLVFNGFSDSKAKFELVAFTESPQKPVSQKEIFVQLPEGSGAIEVAGIKLKIIAVDNDGIRFVRTGGYLDQPGGSESSSEAHPAS